MTRVVETTVGPSVSGVADVVPGPETVAFLASLDLGTLSASELLDVAAAWHRVAAWVAAQELAAVNAFAGRCQDSREAELEVACALRLSAYAADTLIAEAAVLATDLPATRAALAEGVISARHAASVVEAVTLAGLDAEASSVVEAKALRKAGQQNVAQLRRVLTRAVSSADPEAAERRHADQVERRHVRLSDAGDGMACYSAHIEAVAAAKLAATVTDHARALKANDGTLTLDAARADALCELVSVGAAAFGGGQSPAKATVEATIQVTVPLAVLLGVDDGPGELSGHGAVTASQVRAAAQAAGAVWRRVVTDEATGAVLDVGRTRYRPPAAIADTVRAAHPRCVFPACSRPSARCDLDHRRAFGAGGGTSAGNLGPLCRFHHVRHEALSCRREVRDLPRRVIVVA
jgi:hypothetical protein